MGWLRKQILKLFREQRGLTLIEVVLALVVLSFVGTGILRAIETSSRSTQILDEKVVATNLATTHIEAIKEFPFAPTYPDAGDNISIPFQYSVTINTECSSDGTNFSACTGSPSETFQKIVVAVSREGGAVLSICAYRTKR